MYKTRLSRNRSGLLLISKSQDEIVRLEPVAQANVQGVSRRIPILRGPCIHLILHVRGDRINVGTLAERIVVTDAHNITLEIKVDIGISILKSILNAVSSFGIDIAYTRTWLCRRRRGRLQSG